MEVLITDLSKFFDVIPQDMHPLVGAGIGLGTYEELRAHTEGYSYVVPLGDIQSPELFLGGGGPAGVNPRGASGDNGGSPVPCYSRQELQQEHGGPDEIDGTDVGR